MPENEFRYGDLEFRQEADGQHVKTYTLTVTR